MGCAAILCLFSALLPVRAIAQDEAMAERLAALASTGIMKSQSGRFMVVGTNRVDSLLLMRWLEEVSDRVERITGMKLPFENREVRVILRGENGPVEDFVFLEQGFVGKTLIQRFYLSGSDAAYDEDGRQGLCRLLLSGYVEQGARKPLNVPPWLWVGVERNLSPRVRARNMTTVLNAWRRGRLATIDWLLESSNQGKPWSELNAALSGVFLKWISSLPGKKERFAAIFHRLAGDATVTQPWLLNQMSQPGETAALDDLWDRWLLKQSKIVHEVGTVSSLVLDQLSSELLLYQGAYGIPLSANVGSPGVMGDLVALRDEPWIASFVRAKRRRLQLMSAGRGESFKKVVDRYCEFLAKLEEGDREDALVSCLYTAEAAFAVLSARVRNSGGVLRE